MSWSAWFRQIHRWSSIAFTGCVIFVVVAVVVTGEEEPAEWAYFLPLVPLGLLFLTGLYLFALPYARKVAGRPPETSES